MSSERLQKILAQAGVASRRAAEKYISEGRVRVNGEVVHELGAKADPSTDTIEVDGLGVIEAEPIVYIAIHKPIHVVTTVSDPEKRQTVIDVLQMSRAEGRKTFEGNMPRIFPVGRLDFDAEGLLVLTNDGALANDLLHPRYHVPKTYVVKVRGRPDERQLERLRRGVRLREDDGRMSRATAPADINVVRESPSNTWLEMIIVEGRHHQVKRMCDAIGHQVIRLIRTEFGGIELGELEPGQWRFLTDGEVELLRSWRAGNAAELLAGRHGPTMTEKMFGTSAGRGRSAKRSGAPRERTASRGGRDERPERTAARPARAGAPRAASRDGAPRPPARAGSPRPASRDGAPRSMARAGAPRPASRDGAPRSMARAGTPRPASRDGAPREARHDRDGSRGFAHREGRPRPSRDSESRGFAGRGVAERQPRPERSEPYGAPRSAERGSRAGARSTGFEGRPPRRDDAHAGGDEPRRSFRDSRGDSKSRSSRSAGPRPTGRNFAPRGDGERSRPRTPRSAAPRGRSFSPGGDGERAPRGDAPQGRGASARGDAPHGRSAAPRGERGGGSRGPARPANRGGPRGGSRPAGRGPRR